MTTLRVWWQRLLGSFSRTKQDHEFAQELESHVGLHVDECVRVGIAPDRARREALLTLGGLEPTKELHRERRRFMAFDVLWQDVRYAARMLRRAPGFTAVAVISLGVGIGSIAAVYGTVDWLLNRAPGGVVDPDRLFMLNTTDRNHPEMTGYEFSYQQYEDLERVQDAFAAVATYAKFVGTFSTERTAAQVVVENVTGNYFSVLGVRAALGRAVEPEDDTPAAPLVALLSDDFWRSAFGGDPGIVGTHIRLNGQLCQVVGVMPRDYEGFNLDWNGPTNVWVARHAITRLGGRMMTTGQAAPFVPIVARLPPGVSIDAALQKAQAWLPQLRPAVEIGVYRPTGIVARPASTMRIARREQARSFLRLLLVVCTLILLAACVNVANFLVGRAAARRGELALRSALGASRTRVLRQLLTEAMLLGLGAAGFGAAVAMVVAHLLATLPRVYLDLPLTSQGLTTAGAVDWRMAVTAAGLGLGSVLLFGILPALIAVLRNPLEDLKNPRFRWTWSGAKITVRQVVLVVQVALAVALMVTAGLYARSFARAARVDTGYRRPESVLVVHTIAGGLTPDRQRGFHDALWSRLSERPDVVSASLGSGPFVIGHFQLRLPNHDDSPINSAIGLAAPGYFETRGIDVVAGREFSRARDDLRTALIVNRVLADRMWPNQNPLGQSARYLLEPRLRTVVGVVADIHCDDLLAGPKPCAWVPFVGDGSSAYVYVRTKVTPSSFIPVLRQIVRDLEPTVAVAEEAVLSSHIEEATRKQQVASNLSGGLALMGVVLLGIGCVSLFLSMVKDSVKEIAIRMALGATRKTLTRRILSQGLVLAMAGGLLGAAGAWVIGQRVADQLYETTPTDAVAFLGGPVLAVLVASLAVYYAATVATRTNPAKYLRGD